MVILPIFFTSIVTSPVVFAQQEVKKSDSVERIDQAYAWVHAAERIAWKAQMPQAIQVVRFLRENARVADMASGSLRPIADLEYKGSNATQFFITPVAWSDSASASTMLIAFDPVKRVLSVNVQAPISDVEKGFILLKAAFSTQDIRRRNFGNSEIWCASRYGTYNAEMFEYRLSRAYGGSAYRELLVEFSHELLGIAISSSHQIGSWPIRKKESRQALVQGLKLLRKVVESDGTFTIRDVRYSDRLNAIFGPAASEEEQRARHYRFIIHGVFALLDTIPIRVEAEFRKTRFVCGSFVD